MKSALNTAEITIYALLNGAYDDHEFHNRYPNLISGLNGLDLSAHHRLVLDADPYAGGYQIINAIENLKREALDLWEKNEVPGSFAYLEHE